MKSLKFIVQLISTGTLLISLQAQDYPDYGQYGSYGGYVPGNYSNYYGNYSNYYGNYSNYNWNYSNYYGNYSDYYGGYGNYSNYNGNLTSYIPPPLPDPEIKYLTELQGVITSPGYPTEENPNSTYPANSNIIWYKKGNDKTLIQYKIWDFGIEIGEGNSNVSCDFDYLNVSITSIGWKRYCGYVTPQEEIKGMGSFSVQLVTDATANFWGFTSSYRVTEDFDPCHPSPCGNGECEVEDYLPKCVCEAGYTGDQCTVNIEECDSNPCQNGGTCDERNRVDSYVCRCTEEYNGVHCENEKPKPCDRTPCQNNATCENVGMRQFRCYCVDGYEGLYCERRIGDPIEEPQNSPEKPEESRSNGKRDGGRKVPSKKPDSSASSFKLSSLLPHLMFVFFFRYP